MAIEPMLPLGAVFQKIHDQMACGNPKKIVTVKFYEQQMGTEYPADVIAGCLEYFIQKGYAKYVTLDNSAFTITAAGISSWITWFNKDPPKPAFY